MFKFRLHFKDNVAKCQCWEITDFTLETFAMKSLYCKSIGYIREIENDIANYVLQIFVQYLQNTNIQYWEYFPAIIDQDIVHIHHDIAITHKDVVHIFLNIEIIYENILYIDQYIVTIAQYVVNIHL